VPDTFQGDAGALTLTVDGKVEKTIPVESSDRYRLEIEDFADAVLQKRAPYFSLSETLRNMELIDRLLAASLSRSGDLADPQTSCGLASIGECKPLRYGPCFSS